MDSDFLDMLANELGEISHWKEECPGVYYLSFLPESEGALFCAEYYLVLDNAPISKEARGYGQPLENGQGLLFSLEQEGSGAKIIEYEIYRYLVAHQLPLPEGESLHACAVYAAEDYPEYFGMLPVPALTPWGYTARYRALASGVYWIETDRCEEVLAVGHPIWEADLSDSVLRHAHQTAYSPQCRSVWRWWRVASAG